MPILKPLDAINAAIGSYAIESAGSNVEEEFSVYPALSQKFNFQSNNRFESKSGAFLIKSKSGFAVAAMGHGDHFKNDALIAIRGTAGALDWITDANIGIQTTRSGKVVHAGFNRVFTEFETGLKGFLEKHQPSRVHCVGHSLGGALAGITAEWITHKGLGNPYLYTFGSPRIGFKEFSERLTQKVRNDRIFRVHHSNDIVSMIPAWPYTHVPQPGISCNLKDKGFSPVSAHYKENYLHSLKTVKDWSDIKVPDEEILSDVQVMNWLSWDTVTMISTYTLRMIGKAINYIFKLAGLSVHALGIAGFTVLDKLSYALDFAVKISKDVAGVVVLLLKKILKLVGKTIEVTSNITTSFIRWVFDLFSGAVNRLATLAVRATS